VEDDYQCLKTGGRFEQHQLQMVKCFFHLLGVISLVAVRLLQLRDVA
jgi:hypothetical protein